VEGEGRALIYINGGVGREDLRVYRRSQIYNEECYYMYSVITQNPERPPHSRVRPLRGSPPPLDPKWKLYFITEIL